VPTVFFTLLFTALSALCAAYVVKAVQFYRARQAERRKLRTLETGRSPGGEQPMTVDDSSGALLEFELLVRVTTTYPWWVVFQVTYMLSMIMMAVSSIHVVVRAMDDLTILMFRNTYGLQVYPPDKFGFVLSCPAHDACKGVEAFYSVDTSGGFVITGGYLLTALLAIPFSVIEIVDWAQGILYTISLACILEMCIAFALIARAGTGGGTTAASDNFHSGASAAVPAWNYNLGLVIEVSFLTWCLSFSIPMWLEQTAEGVSINAALWWSCLSRGLLFIAFGLIASGAFPDLTTMNVLDVLRTKSQVTSLTQVCGFLFAATSVFPNIIAHSMAVRRNLEAHIGALRANFLGVGLPWAVAWLFYFGAEYNQLVNTCSIYLNGVIQFLLPCLLFLALATAAGAHVCRVAGIRASMDTWRDITRWVALGIVILIVLAYTLNAFVFFGLYGPKHHESASAAKSAASDYGLAAGPALAPAPSKAPGGVRKLRSLLAPWERDGAFQPAQWAW
jgi:hypothetical protein